MGWQDLLQASEGETITLPWVGTKFLHSKDRRWQLETKPPEHGWHTFSLSGRSARWQSVAEPATDQLAKRVKGYLVGDRLIPDGVAVDPDPSKIVLYSEELHLIEPGVDRFVRVIAGELGGQLFYESLDMPMGPEEEVLQAFLNRAESVSMVRGVPPALDAAFRLETWHRADVARRRAEAEQKRREDEERRQREARRQQLVETLGDAQARREMALIDFGEAAKAALIVGGATYLDHRDSYNRAEVIVRFMFRGRRFECTCDKYTLRIIDSGICLTDHVTGEKGDTRFTLESFPGVIAEAIDKHKLVVFRHVDGDRRNYEDDDDY